MYNKVELCGVNTAELPILSEQEKRDLLTRARAGDKKARQSMIEGNLRLVLSVVQRFSQRGELLDFGRSTVQNGRLFVLTLGQKLCRPGHGLPDKIALAGIKIVDRTASLGKLPEFRFRCQMIGSFVFGLFYFIILCPL